jgi:phosphatidylglycerol lysyltransferase
MNLFMLGPAPMAHTRFAHWFVDSIYAIAFGSFGVALLTLLRPVVIRQPASTDERMRAARIVGAHGKNGLTHFALLDDKHFYFHPSGESVVSYVVTQGIGLALGDPIGPTELQKETIVGFIAHCRAHDWKPVFYQTEEHQVYDELGMTTLPIGQCALVDMADFTLEGSKNQEIRQVTNKLAKAGITPQFYPAPQSSVTIAALRDVSDEWLAHKRASEKNFSLGAFSDEYIQESDLQVLETAEGRIIAFANLIPEYPDNTAVIDLMRHRRDIPSGTMLVLLAQLMVEVKARDRKAVDLGLAPLAGLAETDDASSTERILHLLFTRMREPFNFRGLYAFKKKFHPRFETRYVAYPRPADVILALDAVRRADSSLSFWREILSELRRRVISRDMAV